MQYAHIKAAKSTYKTHAFRTMPFQKPCKTQHFFSWGVAGLQDNFCLSCGTSVSSVLGGQPPPVTIPIPTLDFPGILSRDHLSVYRVNIHFLRREATSCFLTCPPGCLKYDAYAPITALALTCSAPNAQTSQASRAPQQSKQNASPTAARAPPSRSLGPAGTQVSHAPRGQPKKVMGPRNG